MPNYYTPSLTWGVKIYIHSEICHRNMSPMLTPIKNICCDLNTLSCYNMMISYSIIITWIMINWIKKGNIVISRVYIFISLFICTLKSEQPKGNTGVDKKSAHPLLLSISKQGYCTVISLGGTFTHCDWDAHGLRNHRPSDWRRWITSIASISVKKN